MYSVEAIYGLSFYCVCMNLPNVANNHKMNAFIFFEQTKLALWDRTMQKMIDEVLAHYCTFSYGYKF